MKAFPFHGLSQTAKGSLLALLATTLFASTLPLMKRYVVWLDPLWINVLVNLGIGVGLLLLWILQSRMQHGRWLQWEIQKRDLPWVGLNALLGSILAPVLITHSLAQIPATHVSLYSSFEGIFTASLAWFVFHQPLDKTVLWGVSAITVGGLILFGGEWLANPVLGIGSAMAILAYLLWSLDTNIIAKVSQYNPIHIICLKSLTGGLVLLALTTQGLHLQPISWGLGLQVALLGFVGYGLSYLIYLIAVRWVGAARTGSFMALSPFLGVAISIGFLGESLSVWFLLALLFVAIGSYFLVIQPFRQGPQTL